MIYLGIPRKLCTLLNTQTPPLLLLPCRDYSDVLITHLDNEKFDDAVQLCQNTIHGATTRVVDYTVPAITGTIK